MISCQINGDMQNPIDVLSIHIPIISHLTINPLLPPSSLPQSSTNPLSLLSISSLYRQNHQKPTDFPRLLNPARPPPAQAQAKARTHPFRSCHAVRHHATHPSPHSHPTHPKHTINTHTSAHQLQQPSHPHQTQLRHKCHPSDTRPGPWRRTGVSRF